MSTNDIHTYNERQQRQYLNETGIFVDIQNIGKNSELIAVKEKDSEKEIRSGVFLTTSSITFPDGSFTNVYDLHWDQKTAGVVPTIESSNEPYSLYDHIKNNPSELAIIDGAFFFLTDVADSSPLDLCYNLCIREGVLMGLPSWDQPIAYVKKGRLKTYEPDAIGTIKIGKQVIHWKGANSETKKNPQLDAMLYNSKCSDVVKVRDPKTNIQIGILDSEHITTPKGNVYDVIVVLDKKGKLRISAINQGGGTHFFKGYFILQFSGKNKTFSVGDSVTPLTLDGLSLKGIDSAITIGRNVKDPFFLDPVRRERRDARSVLAQDRNGNFHFIVFDGSKYIPGFKGSSAEMLLPFFVKKKFKKAYFLDGGGSSRLIVRHGKELNVLANRFAFRKLENGRHLWDWKYARKVASSISLKVLPS